MMDPRITNGFYIATNPTIMPQGQAVLSRNYEGEGDYLLVFGGWADMNEYMVAWGLADQPFEPHLLRDLGSIETLLLAAKEAGLAGVLVNPPLDDRDPEDVISFEELEEWVRSREDFPVE